MHSLNKYIFITFVFVIIFSDELFAAYMVLANTGVISGMKQRWVLVTAGISFLFFIMDLLQNKINKHMGIALLFVFFICIGYYITGIFYNEESLLYELYDTYFYVLMGQVFPATYIGCKLGTVSSLQNMDKILPFFIIPLSLIIGLYGWDVATEGEIVGYQETGFSYQAMSYVSAYFYAYTAYYVFFSPLSIKPRYKFVRITMLINMIFCVLLCLVSGGRGAFVFVVFITVFFIFVYFRRKQHHRLNSYLFLILLVAIFVWLSFYMNIWQTVGWTRVEGRLTEDENRSVLFNKAVEVFLSSPFYGKGIGSIWFTVGFYSHNIITDILAEAGVLGIIIFMFIVIQTLRYYYFLCLNNRTILLMLLIFIAPLTQALFSGYYLASFKLFFSISFAYCYYSMHYKELPN